MSLLRFLATSARRTFRRPIVTLTVTVTFAFVIAFNSAIFSVIDAVWLNALPFTNASRLAVIGPASTKGPTERPGPVTGLELSEWSARTRDFDELAATSIGYGLMTAMVPGGVRTVDVAAITPNLFSVFGATPEYGRVYHPHSEAIKTDWIVLGHDFWRQAFNGDPQIVGKHVRLAWFDGSGDYDVIAVMPRHFQVRFPKPHDAYIPIPADLLEQTNVPGSASIYTVFGLLSEGRTLSDARVSMRQIGDAFNRESRSARLDTTVVTISAHEFFFGKTRPILLALAGASVLILLLACANISSVLLSATLDRAVELSTRLALGASQWRLIAMLILEHTFLGAMGAVAGLALLANAMSVLRQIAPPELPRMDVLAVNWTVVLVSLVLAMFATLVSSLYPSLRLRRLTPGLDLRKGGRPLETEARRSQQLLLAGQVALVVTLLVAAVSMVASLRGLLLVKLGFTPDALVAVRTRFSQEHYGPAGALLQDRVTREILTRSGIVSAGWTSEIPLGPPNVVHLRLRGQDRIASRYRIVSARYLETIGASLIRGRLFESRDRDGAAVMVVNRSFVNRYLRNQEPIGKELYVRDWHHIIGVIDDVREGSLEDGDAPTVYWQFSGQNWMAGAPWLVVRTRDAKRWHPEALRSFLSSVESSLPVGGAERITDRVRQHTAKTRFLTVVIGGIAIVALSIAAVGVFGMMSYSVRRRRQEMALRVALGASRRAVGWHSLRNLSVVSGIGIAVGLLISWVTNRWIRALLFGVEPTDNRVVLAVIAVLTCTIVASAVMPLRRALSVDPANALREQ